MSSSIFISKNTFIGHSRLLRAQRTKRRSEDQRDQQFGNCGSQERSEKEQEHTTRRNAKKTKSICAFPTYRCLGDEPPIFFTVTRDRVSAHISWPAPPHRLLSPSDHLSNRTSAKLFSWSRAPWPGTSRSKPGISSLSLRSSSRASRASLMAAADLGDPVTCPVETLCTAECLWRGDIGCCCCIPGLAAGWL